ncbi:hypothetical protein AGA_1P152 (plasmid) [Acetobacter orientalis]|uniref:Uncharacterized protein n=1 Tax=Acetobacter orientalis TaxID=146474 RepID=A0A2Z5ZMA4_9PROT|nr:hypothetical protein AGA_1P152 [Acetobacter orientalis]
MRHMAHLLHVGRPLSHHARAQLSGRLIQSIRPTALITNMHNGPFHSLQDELVPSKIWK